MLIIVAKKQLTERGARTHQKKNATLTTEARQQAVTPHPIVAEGAATTLMKDYAWKTHPKECVMMLKEAGIQVQNVRYHNAN